MTDDVPVRRDHKYSESHDVGVVFILTQRESLKLVFEQIMADPALEKTERQGKIREAFLKDHPFEKDSPKESFVRENADRIAEKIFIILSSSKKSEGPFILSTQ